MSKWHNTTLFRIIVPIFLISIVVIWLSEQFVEKIFVKQISKTAINELETSTDRLYGVTKSRYEILFFSHGTDEKSFRELEPAVKQEAIRDLKSISKASNYLFYLYDGSKYIPLNGNNRSISFEGIKHWDANGLIGKNIYASKSFLPWGWRFVAIYDHAKLEAITEVNKQTIALIIIAVAVLIGLTIIIILYRAVNIPFRHIFTHLDKIKNGEYESVSIDKMAAEEIRSLGMHINDMSQGLKAKKEEREQLIERLKEERFYTKTILDSQTSIVIVTNGNEILDCNQAFLDFFAPHKKLEEFKSAHRCVCSFFEGYDDGEQQYFEPLENDWVKKAVGLEQRALMRKDGIPRHFGVNAKQHRQNGETVFIVTMDDITALVSQKNELRKRLYTDALTHLPNRTKLLLDMVGTESPVLFLINIDSFSTINDLYGYKIGDQLLALLATKLNKAIALFKSVYKFDKEPHGWMLYKLSSDEYAFLMPEAPTKGEQEKIAYSIYHLIDNAHFWCQGIDIEIKVTIGISDSDKITLDDWDKPKNTISDADMALKKAKNEGLSFLFYKDEMDLKTNYIKNIECAKKLKNAIAEERIVPYFQPIQDIKTGKIQKYEVLMRMIDDGGCAIGPLSFLEVAKSSKQYAKLTRIIVQKSFEWFADKPYEFSINISYEDITDEETKQYIIDMLQKYNIGKRVIFEFLESEGIKNYEDVKAFIEEVRKYGCKCAIDDFGSGYSSFEHILTLKTEYLKIDGSIIKNIDKDNDAKAIAKAIVSFANDLGIKTVAEFVHSEDVMRTVTELGITYAQGYLISEPKPSTH
jgi:diguanylate cyclase (GGDEF)-like protein